MSDTDPLLDSLASEQRRLRRQVRGLTAGLGFTLALLLAVGAQRWLRSEVAPTELRTTRLVITDEQNRVRAEFGFALNAAEPHLVLYHPDGRRWAALAIAAPQWAPDKNQAASLLLFDEAGQARVELGTSQWDTGLAFYDPQGGPGLALYLDPDFQGLAIFGGGAPRILLRYNQHHDAELSELLFRDEQKRQQAALIGGRGGVSLELNRPDGGHAFRVER